MTRSLSLCLSNTFYLFGAWFDSNPICLDSMLRSFVAFAVCLSYLFVSISRAGLNSTRPSKHTSPFLLSESIFPTKLAATPRVSRPFRPLHLNLLQRLDSAGIRRDLRLRLSIPRGTTKLRIWQR